MLANPYILIAIAASLVVTHGVVAWKSFRLGQNDIIAEEAKLDEVRKESQEAALAAAAAEIAKLEVRHVTIRQKAETVTREVPVYRDCRHTPDGLQLVNDALQPPGSDSPAGELPRSGTAGGPDIRSDNPEAD